MAAYTKLEKQEWMDAIQQAKNVDLELNSDLYSKYSRFKTPNTIATHSFRNSSISSLKGYKKDYHMYQDDYDDSDAKSVYSVMTDTDFDIDDDETQSIDTVTTRSSMTMSRRLSNGQRKYNDGSKLMDECSISNSAIETLVIQFMNSFIHYF